MDVLEAIYRSIEKNPKDWEAYEDAFDCIRDMDGIQVAKAHELQRKVRNASLYKELMGNAYELNRRILCYCAPECTDDFALYIEMDRPIEKQFYMPRRKQLRPLADALDRLDRREIRLLGISMPPGTGKTTLALMYCARLSGRHPEKPILIGSHSNSFLRGTYGELLRYFSPDGEYLFRDVFPDVRVISTNAQDMQIDLGRDARDSKRFTTLMLSSIGSGNAGKVRAEQLLYCDDLVSDLEEAMSRERMDKKWESYSTDLRQRKIGDCAELHIATRWSVHDIIGRLERLYEGNPEAEFIVCPALNEKDESNFDYPIPQGFITKFYHEQREIMDDASWRALYMNQPIEREGLLYSETELRRYFELPEEEPDAIISVCDTKDRGSDYCVMPIAYQYGTDYYIEDVICDNSNPEVVEPRLTSKCLEHKVHMSRFESNSAGGHIAVDVEKRIRELGGKTHITTKFTSENKETKIIANSAEVKRRCLFRDPSTYKKNTDYGRLMNNITTYTMTGKNQHDDGPDVMAMLIQYAESFNAGKAEVFQRPW